MVESMYGPLREFLHLGHVYDSKKHHVGGWFMSEKLDGVRCFWDGGATRGIPVKDVPFANLNSEHIRLKERLATGLWSRYGHPWHAPDWFLNTLPPYNLDGELYLGPDRFNETTSIVKRLEPDSRWKEIKFVVFDVPSTPKVFARGRIKHPNYEKIITDEIAMWVLERQQKPGLPERQFASAIKFMQMFLPKSQTVAMLHQEELPYQQGKAIDRVNEKMAEVLAKKGEGLMLRDGCSVWTPKRNHTTLKVKNKLDSEGTIIGYRSANPGKIHGKIGALILNWGGVIFDLSGLTDEERMFSEDGTDWALNHPEKVAPLTIEAKHFKRGDVVTFTYATLTDKGVPREARFLRKRPVE